MFNIGDKVFRATYGRKEKWITCPDCFGTKRIKVILGDGTEMSIECGGCNPGGYQPSLGVIRQYDYETEVKQHTVTGITTRADEVNYELDNFGGCGYYTGSKKDVFGTREEAQIEGDRLRAEHESDENKRWLAKTKDARSWAWNATYHRNCLKRAEKDAEYHRGKIQVCAAKAKETA